MTKVCVTHNFIGFKPLCSRLMVGARSVEGRATRSLQDFFEARIGLLLIVLEVLVGSVFRKQCSYSLLLIIDFD